MITNSGYKIAINRIAKAVPDYTAASRFKVGINQATETTTDTDITLPIPITGTETVDDCEATTDWVAGTDGAITTNSSTYKVGTYALNLTKDAGTVDNVLWANESEDSLDFTSKDLWGWIYIKDATTLAKLAETDALEVRFGNDDDTNYYYYKYDRADLAVGWNYIKFNITDATEEGTVTDNACDSLGIKLTYTGTAITTSAGDIVIDDFKLASSGDYYKDFEVGYPTIDETNFEIVTESYLLSTDANGYNISGIGTFNTDGTVLMQDVFKFTAISKDSTEEIGFFVKNRLKRR